MRANFSKNKWKNRFFNIFLIKKRRIRKETPLFYDE